MRKCVSTAILVLLIALLMSLPADAAEKPGGKVKAFVSILPIAYFVERVGGPNVEVSVLVGPGQDPHTFEPTPRLMTKLANARLLYKMGFPFEETIIKKIRTTFKNVEVVDLQQGIKVRTLTEEEAEAEEAEHEHGHGHGEAKHDEHSHEPGEIDQHTWLDPQLAKIQARTIADSLIRSRLRPQRPLRKKSERLPGRSGHDPRGIDQGACSGERQELFCISPRVRLFRRCLWTETNSRANRGQRTHSETACTLDRISQRGRGQGYLRHASVFEEKRRSLSPSHWRRCSPAR